MGRSPCAPRQSYGPIAHIELSTMHTNGSIADELAGRALARLARLEAWSSTGFAAGARRRRGQRDFSCRRIRWASRAGFRNMVGLVCSDARQLAIASRASPASASCCEVAYCR